MKALREFHIKSTTLLFSLLIATGLIALALIERAEALFFGQGSSPLTAGEQCTTDLSEVATEEDEEVFFVNCGGFF